MRSDSDLSAPGARAIPGVSADDEDGKITQAAVLYMPAAAIGRKAGTRCGDCWKFVRTGMCVEVIGSIEAAKTCGLYVHGTPFDDLPSFSVTKVSKQVAGYGEGNTHCAGCRYFGGSGRCKEVKSGPEKIEAGGCCNNYKGRSNAARD